MKSQCDFYLDRAARCLDMADHIDKQYREDLIQIAQGWVQLAEEEANWDTALGESVALGEAPDDHPLAPVTPL